MIDLWYRLVCFFKGHKWVRTKVVHGHEICGRCHAVRKRFV